MPGRRAVGNHLVIVEGLRNDRDITEKKLTDVVALNVRFHRDTEHRQFVAVEETLQHEECSMDRTDYERHCQDE
jgi:hypothetical protein